MAAASAADPVATTVNLSENVLGDQGFYDIALAVAPSSPNRIVIGGMTFETKTPDGRMGPEPPATYFRGHERHRCRNG